MSAGHSQYVACAVADAALDVPVFYPLRLLAVARFEVEQVLTRASHAADDGFLTHLPTGERQISITLEGMSDGSQGEGLLASGALQRSMRRMRFDTAQGERLEGDFWVVRYVQDARGDALEQIRVALRSQEAVTLV